jgi:hypothetical protein
LISVIPKRFAGIGVEDWFVAAVQSSGPAAASMIDTIARIKAMDFDRSNSTLADDFMFCLISMEQVVHRKPNSSIVLEWSISQLAARTGLGQVVNQLLQRDIWQMLDRAGTQFYNIPGSQTQAG